MESRRRTLVKSALWMLIGFIAMALVGFLFTGSFVTGGSMALINALIGFLSYIVYERMWARISWGRNV